LKGRGLDLRWFGFDAESGLGEELVTTNLLRQRVVGGDEDPGILGMVPVTIPQLLRQLRGTVIPDPRRDRTHCDGWSLWRRRHQYQARQAHQRWHAYADEVPE